MAVLLRLRRALVGLQRSQLSVQALSRLASVAVFLLASWTDSAHLGLIALQGVLFAIPYTLLESLVGRPLSADLVPQQWSVEHWARRAAAVTVAPVAVVGYLSATVALPGSSAVARLLMVLPVLVQLPLEAVFWAAARTRERRRANLIPQLTAVGTVLGGVLFALAHLPIYLCPLPAQLAVLTVLLVGRVPGAAGRVRPGPLRSVRVGAPYATAAAIDLIYAVALPSVAGRLVGPVGLVVMRALDLAFGPFQVALAATVREDIVAGRDSRFGTATRALTVLALVGVSAAMLGSTWVRRLLAEDLAAVGTAAVALYCGYKLVMMLSTWASIRHMIRAAPRRFLVSAIGSRALAIVGMAVALLWVHRITDLFAQLLGCEVLVLLWYLLRIRGTPATAGQPPRPRTATDPAAELAVELAVPGGGPADSAGAAGRQVGRAAPDVRIG